MSQPRIVTNQTLPVELDLGLERATLEGKPATECVPADQAVSLRRRFNREAGDRHEGGRDVERLADAVGEDVASQDGHRVCQRAFTEIAVGCVFE